MDNLDFFPVSCGSFYRYLFFISSAPPFVHVSLYYICALLSRKQIFCKNGKTKQCHDCFSIVCLIINQIKNFVPVLQMNKVKQLHCNSVSWKKITSFVLVYNSGFQLLKWHSLVGISPQAFEQLTIKMICHI